MKVLKICNSHNQIIYSLFVLVNYHMDTFFGIGYRSEHIHGVYIHVVQVDKYMRREVEETLSGVYMVNIHLQVEIVNEGMKMVTKKTQ